MLHEKFDGGDTNLKSLLKDTGLPFPPADQQTARYSANQQHPLFSLIKENGMTVVKIGTGTTYSGFSLHFDKEERLIAAGMAGSTVRYAADELRKPGSTEALHEVAQKLIAGATGPKDEADWWLKTAKQFNIRKMPYEFSQDTLKDGSVRELLGKIKGAMEENLSAVTFQQLQNAPAHKQ